MIDFTEIDYNSDHWEMFARDFLSELGLTIESPPDRGGDQGKDMLVVEEVGGRLFRGNFRWLVSCKHYATSGRSVNETQDEPNILERVGSFNADGFIGFYSTVPSAGLNTRLRQLRNEQKLKDYRIFDHKLIENYLVTAGFAHLMLRYFPESYKTVKPLHYMTDKYEPLPCRVCGKDLLQELFRSAYQANMVFEYESDSSTGKEHFIDVYCVCKEPCDRQLNLARRNQTIMTSWKDISDLVIPIEFLRSLFAMMNRIRSGNDTYTEQAYEQQKAVFIAIAQKVLRYTTEREKQRVATLLSLPF